MSILLQTAPAVTTWSPLDACTEAGCREATSPEETCRCRCGGAGHGHPHREGKQAARAAFQARSIGGFTNAMLAAMDGDDLF